MDSWEDESEEAEVVRLPDTGLQQRGLKATREDSGAAVVRRRRESRKKKAGEVEAVPEMGSLHEVKREVYELGATAFDKRAKKILEAEKVVAYGGRAPKNPKMPLKMLMGIRRAEKARAERAAEEQRASGVVAPVAKLDNVLRPTGKKKAKRRDRGLGDDLKDGVLRVSPHMLVQGRGNKRQRR